MRPYTEAVVSVRHGRFRVEREQDRSVRIPEAYLKCVAFVGEVAHRDSSGNIEGDLCSTGFFVGLPSPVSNKSFACFVTAKHVANDLKNKEVYFLVNKKGAALPL